MTTANPDTTAQLSGSPADLVVAGETNPVPLNGSSQPNTESSITATKDLTAYGARSNLNIPLSYSITAGAVTPGGAGGYGPAALSGTCEVDSGTVKKHPKLLVGGVWCIADLEYEIYVQVDVFGLH